MTPPYDLSARKDLPDPQMLSLPIRSAAGRPDIAGRQVPPTVASSSRHALPDSNLATQGDPSTKALIPTGRSESTQDVAYRNRFVPQSISDNRLPVNRMEPEDQTDEYDMDRSQREWGEPRNLRWDVDINAAMLHDPDPYEPDPLNDNMKPTEADMDIPYILFQKVQAQLNTYQAVLPNLAAEAIAKHKAASKAQPPGTEGKDDSDEEWVPLSARDLSPKEQDTVKVLLIRVEQLTDNLMSRNIEIWRLKRHCANMHKAYNDMNEAYIKANKDMSEAYIAREKEKDAEIKWLEDENFKLTLKWAEARGINIYSVKEESAQGEAMDVDAPTQLSVKGKQPCQFGDGCRDAFAARRTLVGTNRENEGV
ncbi:hypothetical protein GRF29_77g882869 [Pseudopithomyces chartarum]|uniref:Uncharacterized protein n=1 Tax=Pseudopithomyces chartarum TaxID=1892770 RepID=A0AAN6LWI9_9PLEO|nr:hypothetical protein GRF29_77g882869 [Pseudopithomyces chartarum]